MKLKQIFAILLLLGSASICVAQVPTVSNHATGSSQIIIRIPAYAIITLADNSSKTLTTKSPSDPKKLNLSEQVAASGIISNGKWSVNAFKEDESVNLTALNNSSKTSGSNIIAESVTVVYVTSMN